MTNTTETTQLKVTELNQIFKVNLKKWDEAINFYMSNDDEDYYDASLSASKEDKLKKEFIFISYRTASKKDCIKCIGNSFSIKEELKIEGLNKKLYFWQKGKD